MPPTGAPHVSSTRRVSPRARRRPPAIAAAARRLAAHATFRPQVVTALPDIHVMRRQPDDLCIVIASDGLFGGVMSSAAVAERARAHLEGPLAHAADAEKQTARHLTELALCEHQGSDNVSVVVVSLAAPPAEGPVSELFRQLPETATSTLHASAGAMDGEDAEEARPRPVPLSYQLSQESVTSDTTADPCSPGRIALHAKLRMPFEIAYPRIEEGEERLREPSCEF